MCAEECTNLPPPHTLPPTAPQGELAEFRRYMLYCRGLKHKRPDLQRRFWMENLGIRECSMCLCCSPSPAAYVHELLYASRGCATPGKGWVLHTAALVVFAIKRA